MLSCLLVCGLDCCYIKNIQSHAFLCLAHILITEGQILANCCRGKKKKKKYKILKIKWGE